MKGFLLVVMAVASTVAAHTAAKTDAFLNVIPSRVPASARYRERFCKSCAVEIQNASAHMRVASPAFARAKRSEDAPRHPTVMRHAEVRLTTGVRVHYVEQGDPNGPPIILLHGYSDSWVSYTRVLPLIDRKYRVYVPDLRGHGDSDRPASGYTFPNFAGDIIAFMDAKGLKKATIVGHSMGSFVAQHVAVMAPERVEKLVLVGSAPAVSNGEISQLQIDVNALNDPVPVKFVTEFQKSVISKPVPDEFMDRVIQESLKLPARVWRDTMAGMLSRNLTVTLSKIEAPTLIIWGDRESVFPKRGDQEVLRKAIRNATLKVYEGTGHCPNWEEPARFVKDLEEFIGKA
jgi:non-heme chloroperoxidase